MKRTNIPGVDRALNDIHRALRELEVATGLNDKSSGRLIADVRRQSREIEELNGFRLNGEARLDIGEHSIHAFARAGSLTRVAEDADTQPQTSVSVDPLTVTIPNERDLVLVDAVFGEVPDQVITLSAIARTGAEVLNIETETLTLKEGMYVLPAPQLQQADVWITPYFIRQSVESERKGRNIGTTNASLDGDLTSANVDLKQGLKNNDEIEFVDRISGLPTVAFVDGDVSSGSGVTLNFDDGSGGAVTFDELPTNSGIRLTDRQVKSTLTIHDNSISLNASNISTNTSNIASVTATANDNSAQVVLKAESTAGGITKLALVQLDASVASGSALALIADEVTIRTDGSEAVFDGNGLTFTSSATYAASSSIDFKNSGGTTIGSLWMADVSGGFDRMELESNGEIDITSVADITVDCGDELILNAVLVDVNGTFVSIAGTVTINGDTPLVDNSVSGSFTTNDGKTVNVSGGQITSIT